MPSSTGTRDAAPSRPTSSTASAVAGDGAQAPVAPPLGDDPALAAAFWRARAEELADRLGQLEQRLAALAERLPSRWVPLLTCDPASMPQVAFWPDPLAGWHETTDLVQARVASTLPRLWQRLDADA